MPTHEIVVATAHAINGKAILNCSLTRRVALGVKEGGVDGTDAWVILSFVNGHAQMEEIRQCGSLDDPDATLDVSIVMCAKDTVWIQIGEGGVAAAVAAADTRSIIVSGKLPYFIRNVRSSVDLMVLFGSLFAQHSGQVA